METQSKCFLFFVVLIVVISKVDTNVHAHSSTVSVIAENSSGMDETGVRLTIEEVWSLISGIWSFIPINDVQKPSVTRELKDQTVNRGDFAHFEAVIQQATKVTWMSLNIWAYFAGNDVNVKAKQDKSFVKFRSNGP